VTHALHPDEPDGWPGVFQPRQHYVRSGARRLLLGGDLIVFAACDAPCRPPNENTATLPWCFECRLVRARDQQRS
jgi:hypothetical protein